MIMAKFLNQVHSEDCGYFEGRLVRKIIEEPLIWVHDCRRGEMPIDFESDGASVPRLPLIYDAWGDKAHREAFWHDFGYRQDSFVLTICDPVINANTLGYIDPKYIIRKDPIAKEDADWWFRITLRDRMSVDPNTQELVHTYTWGTYQPMYWAVRACGDSSFHRMKVADHFQCLCDPK
jgi:hypothetical protein